MVPGIGTGLIQPFSYTVYPHRIAPRKKRCRQFGNLGQFGVFHPVCGNGQMVFPGEYLRDTLRERISGTEFDESAHTVFPRLTDGGWEIDRGDSLARQHVRHARLRGHVGGIDSVRVETDVAGAGNGPRVEFPPFVLEGFHGVGVNNKVLMHQCAGAGTQALTERAAGVGGAADHQVIIGIDDRDLDIRRG